MITKVIQNKVKIFLSKHGVIKIKSAESDFILAAKVDKIDQ